MNLLIVYFFTGICTAGMLFIVAVLLTELFKEIKLLEALKISIVGLLSIATGSALMIGIGYAALYLLGVKG